MRNSVLPTGLERLETERLRARVGRLFAALSEVVEDVQPGVWSPPIDLYESAQAITVCVEVPGMSAEHLEISLTGAHLRVCGKKKRRGARGVLSHLCSERSYGSFSRTLPLRWPVNVREATATLKDGLLRITLPKLADRRGANFKVPIVNSES